jgi:hypothetical protein
VQVSRTGGAGFILGPGPAPLERTGGRNAVQAPATFWNLRQKQEIAAKCAGNLVFPKKVRTFAHVNEIEDAVPYLAFLKAYD